MIIYKTTNLINNKIYIGKDTKNNPLYMGSGLLITRAINKYGIKNFKKEILEHCDTIETLNKREIYWIGYYKSCDENIGYNIAIGGDGGYLCINCPEKLRGENYYLNKMSEEERELHLNSFRRGINYWKSRGFLTIQEIEQYIEDNLCGDNHSHRKYKTESEYQQWLNDNRRGDNYWLNKLSKEQRNEYIEDHYKGKNNFIYKGKTDEEIELWLNENRRGKNAPNAKYFYIIKTNTEEIIKTECLETTCKERNFNLHILRKYIELNEGKRKSFIPRIKFYVGWEVKRFLKSNKK